MKRSARARDLLIEIGTEELPAAAVEPALDALRDRLCASLDAARLGHGALEVYGTPRRLAVITRSVSGRQPDRIKKVMGPPSRAAFDASGTPTRAAEGFARGQGVQIDALEVVDTPKGQYVAARIEEAGQQAEEILPELLHSVVAGMPFKKSMRWGEVGVSFARPIHWLLALLGTSVISFGYGDVASGKRTRGHRFLSPRSFALQSPRTYLERLEKAKVIADVDTRRQKVLEDAQRALAEHDSGWRLRDDPELLREVTQLVEWPVAIVGSFEPAHLDLPPEVLVSEMRHHQRYFSVVDESTGGLAPAFVAVSNTPVSDPDVVRAGYERVLAARLADARYFFDTDSSRRLEQRVDGLGRVVFQEKLGSVLDKVERVRALALWVASRLELEKKQRSLGRAITLAKADLTTGMVGEFPDLQGVMGRYYALADGEPEPVARAIEEHYLPRHSGDSLPSTDEGAIASIADRLDTLAGIFGIDKPPSGTADPFGLRRACLGVVAIILDRRYRFSMTSALSEAIALYEGRLTLDAATTRSRVLDFFRGRLRNLWTAKGYSVDVVEAVLTAGFDDVVAALERVEALTSIKKHPDFLSLAVAFTRASNIFAKAPSIDAQDVDPQLFESPTEKALWKSLMSVQEKVDTCLRSHDYAAALHQMIALRAPVDAFFDGVLVMAEDARVRDNRLIILRGIVDLFGRIADFSKIRSEAQGS